MARAKELIYDEARNTTGHGNALRIIEDLYGEGYVSEFYKQDYEANAWENGRGKGAYRTEAYNGTEIATSEDLKYQNRSDTLMDSDAIEILSPK